MGPIIVMLSVLATAGVLYYMGKSGFKWGENKDENQDDLK